MSGALHVWSVVHVDVASAPFGGGFNIQVQTMLQIAAALSDEGRRRVTWQEAANGDRVPLLTTPG